jgi:dTDP-4-dehydrorhamnose 3,5-epimerase
MRFERQEIPEILLVFPTMHSDIRGFFSETFRADSFAAHGLEAAFVQDNHTYSSKKGVLRGLHFQLPPHAQGKLVRCVRGAIFDVSVDIRVGSPSYGRHVGLILSAENCREVWIPPGFAHGYVALENNAEVIYKVTDYYAPECDSGIAWDDPALAIDWRLPSTQIILSDKDRKYPRLSEAMPAFHFGR